MLCFIWNQKCCSTIINILLLQWKVIIVLCVQVTPLVTTLEKLVILGIVVVVHIHQDVLFFFCFMVMRPFIGHPNAARIVSMPLCRVCHTHFWWMTVGYHLSQSSTKGVLSWQAMQADLTRHRLSMLLYTRHFTAPLCHCFSTPWWFVCGALGPLYQHVGGRASAFRTTIGIFFVGW